jgi:hypothetical protein
MKNLVVTISFGLITASAQSMVWQSDGTPQNIQFIHDNRAVDGDTITIPSGTFSWTGTVLLTKAITLQGNTTTDPVNGTANTQTLILDDQPDRNSALIELRNGGMRLTGLAFTAGQTVNGQNGMIRLATGTIPIRIDHCDFNNVYWNNTLGVFDRNYGVIDHCVRRNSPVQNAGFLHCWFGRLDDGNSDFEAPAGFGGPNFFFMEDNYMDGGTDITKGGKICARFNIITNNNSFGAHGTSRSSPTWRGGRAYEVYGNQFRYTNNFSSIDGPDGGSAVYYDNTVDPHSAGIACQVYRLIYSFSSPFNGANGLNAWDFNATEADGTHVNGHSPFVFDSGTFTSGTNAGTDTLVDSSKDWTTNQWVGFSVKQLGGLGPTGIIVSNTNNTLHTSTWHQDQAFSVGGSYQIGKVLRVLDQPGLGQGDRINTASPAWPNQVTEPMYEWNNTSTDDGSSIDYTVAVPQGNIIQSGRDYFNNTVMPGYVPYCYPHPMVSGVPCTPGTPTPTPTATATPTPTPATGLVAAYGFNEGSGTVVNDASGNGNNGAVNGATWTSSGKYGNALNFNGSNALVTINNAASLQLTTGMTLEAWVYPTVTGPWWKDVIYKGNDNYYLEGTSYSSGFPAMGGTLPNAPPLYGTAVLALNTWAHLAGTYDGATMRLYVNGVPVASRAQTGAIETSTNPLQIGGDSIYGQYFTGRIDEVRIYNRALSPAQIQSDMKTPL